MKSFIPKILTKTSISPYAIYTIFALTKSGSFVCRRKKIMTIKGVYFILEEFKGRVYIYIYNLQNEWV